MAGTRLFIQSLALIQLIVLVTWSFYYGFCRNNIIPYNDLSNDHQGGGDALCHELYHWFVSTIITSTTTTTTTTTTTSTTTTTTGSSHWRHMTTDTTQTSATLLLSQLASSHPLPVLQIAIDNDNDKEKSNREIENELRTKYPILSTMHRQQEQEQEQDKLLVWEMNFNFPNVCDSPEQISFSKNQDSKTLLWWCPINHHHNNVDVDMTTKRNSITSSSSSSSPPSPPLATPRIVVRSSNTFIFSEENKLLELLKPNDDSSIISSPFTLHVHIVLEKSISTNAIKTNADTAADMTSKGQSIAAISDIRQQQIIHKLSHWPCVESVVVHMTYTEENISNRWLKRKRRPSATTTEGTATTLTREDISKNVGTDETTLSYHLPQLSISNAQTILDKLPDLSVPKLAGHEQHQHLVLFVPSLDNGDGNGSDIDTDTNNKNNSSIQNVFEIGLDSDEEGGDSSSSCLLMVGSEWHEDAITTFLSQRMGVPTEFLDTDGSFPTWYEEWYWYTIGKRLSKRILKEFSRIQHLSPMNLNVDVDLYTDLNPYPSSSQQREYYYALLSLYHHYQRILSTSILQTEFPLEHYAAIFAPLLFPLFLPFIAGTIKELKRYKEKKRQKKNAKESKVETIKDNDKEEAEKEKNE